MKKIGVLGAGSWAIALTKLLANNNHQLVVWSISQDEVEMLNEHRENIDKLPGVKLPSNVSFTTDIKSAIVLRYSFLSIVYMGM